LYSPFFFSIPSCLCSVFIGGSRFEIRFCLWFICHVFHVSLPDRDRADRRNGLFFLVVTLGIVNSIASLANYELLVIANTILVFVTFVLGRWLNLTHENHQIILYDNLEFMKPEHRQALLKDLTERTGLQIHKIQVIKIDFQRVIAQLKVYYYSKENESSGTDLEA